MKVFYRDSTGEGDPSSESETFYKYAGYSGSDQPMRRIYPPEEITSSVNALSRFEEANRDLIEASRLRFEQYLDERGIPREIHLDRPIDPDVLDFLTGRR